MKQRLYDQYEVLMVKVKLFAETFDVDITWWDAPPIEGPFYYIEMRSESSRTLKRIGPGEATWLKTWAKLRILLVFMLLKLWREEKKNA